MASATAGLGRSTKVKKPAKAQGAAQPQAEQTRQGLERGGLTEDRHVAGFGHVPARVTEHRPGFGVSRQPVQALEGLGGPQRVELLGGLAPFFVTLFRIQQSPDQRIARVR